MRNRLLYTAAFFIVLFSLYAGAAEKTHRIVSLAPSNTTKASDLGLSEYLVGITKFCIQPADATDAVVIGTLSNPNLELIATLNPTLVLGDVESNRPDILDRLETLGLNVLRLGPSQNLEDITQDFMKIAEVTYREEFAKSYVQLLNQRLNVIDTALKQVKRKRVFVEIWPKPLMTVSKRGFIHHVIERAGGINVFADAPAAYPQISIESVIAMRPEVILILTHSLIDDTRVKRYREFPDFDDAIIQQANAPEFSQPSLSSFLKSTEYFLSILHPTIKIKQSENQLRNEAAKPE